jgi:hypothetical protein
LQGPSARSFGLLTRREGYRSGLKDTLRLCPLVIALLVVAAIYEAVEIIYIVPLFL